MNSHSFPSAPRRGGRRADDLLANSTLQNLLNPFSFADLSFNDTAINSRRGYQSMNNSAQDFERPNLRVRGLPFDRFPSRSFGIPSLRTSFLDNNPRASFGGRYPFHTLNPELPRRAHLFDVDRDRLARIGVRNSNLYSEESPGPFAFHDCNSIPEQSPDSQRARIEVNPRFISDELRAQERQLPPFHRHQPILQPGVFRNLKSRSASQKDCALPFGKAMRWLHEGLVEVENVFKKFQDDYHREVKAIEKYAGEEILQILWARKVTGKPKDNAQDRSPDEKWEEELSDKRTTLLEAIEAALSASLSLGDQDTPKPATLDSRKRLQEKVETAGYHIKDLLNLVAEDSEYCRALLDELRLLKNLVDPKKKENRELYGGVDVGPSPSGQDNGESYIMEDTNDDGQVGWG